jgi:predicted anti-sigma-YlaC factor YlaD
MSDHESARQLLALSAAGLLAAGEERLVREHARQCARCAAKLDDYAALSAGLAALPAPHPPAYLLARTTMLVAAELDRRQGAAFAGAAAIFALVFVLLIGQTLRMVAGDTAALAWLLWAVVSSVFGAASALLLAPRRRLERSNI